MLIVGEASGDLHGASLVRSLREKEPDLEISAVCGERLKREGVKVIFDVEQLTGMGFTELVGNARNILKAYRRIQQRLKEEKPSLLVLIDFPEFNLRLARSAKKLGVPVLYYISPQVWAWRRYRIRAIARSVDRMAVVFDFEVPLYQKVGAKVDFVGHPLLDIVRATESREVTLAKYGLDSARLTIAILPGSRKREVHHHLPAMLEGARYLQGERAAQFIIIRSSTVDLEEYRHIDSDTSLRIVLAEGDVYNVVNASDMAWVASGTATLEAALLKKPMIIVFRASWPTYLLARSLVHVDYIGMVNILAGEELAPELIQSEVTGQRIFAESSALLRNEKRRVYIVEKLSMIRDKLGSPGAAQRVADMALSMVS